MENKDSVLKKAAALKYDPRSNESAPQLVAKGTGNIAERIIQLAKENNISIHEDEALVEVLSKLDLMEEIPPKLYGVIAEILAFIYQAESKLKKNFNYS